MADRTFKLKFLGDASNAISESNKLGKSMGGMGKAALVGGVAMGAATTGVLVSAVKVAATYEKAIGAVGAISQANAEQQKALFETGKRIGKDTAFSATEAAQAMELLAQNGVSVDDIINGAADATVALAAATGKGLVVAAGAASQAMAVWKIPMSEMPDLINRAAGAALVGKFDIEDLNLAMGQGGGVAMSAGVSWRDFFTTIAAGSDLFTSGADAGTSYKSFLQSLTPNTKKARIAMQDLGLMTKQGTNLFYDQNGALKDGAAIAGLLADATKGLTEEERSLAFETLFGTDGARTAIALARAGADGYQAMSDKMKNTDAQAIAAQRMDNLMGAAERFAGSIESLQLRLTPLLGPLAQLVDILSAGIEKIPTPVLAAFAVIGLLIGGLSALGLAIMPIVTLMGPLGLAGAASALAPLIAAAFPFLLVAAAVAAIIGSGYLLMTHWDEVQAKAGSVRDSILGAMGLENSATAKSALSRDTFIGSLPVVGGAYRSLQSLGVIGGGNNRTQMGELSPEGYATGGMVPGSGPRLAIVHGGEQVLTPAQQRGGGGITINMPPGFMVGTEADFARLVSRALGDQRVRGAPLGG